MNKIDKYFNFIGAPDGPIGSNARKPALASFQPLWREYKQINISKDNIFLIGDTVESDFRLARVCGLKFFAVIGDIFTREEFLAAVRRHATEYFASLVRRAQIRGELRPGVPRQATLFLLDAVFDRFLQAVAVPALDVTLGLHQATDAAIHKHIRELISLLKEGLAA